MLPWRAQKAQSEHEQRERAYFDSRIASCKCQNICAWNNAGARRFQCGLDFVDLLESSERVFVRNRVLLCRIEGWAEEHGCITSLHRVDITSCQETFHSTEARIYSMRAFVCKSTTIKWHLHAIMHRPNQGLWWRHVHRATCQNQNFQAVFFSWTGRHHVSRRPVV